MGEPKRDTGIGPLHSDSIHRLRVFCNFDWASDGYRFFFRMRRLADDGPSKRLTVDSFAIREVEAGEFVSPAFVLSEEEAQNMMDSLWQAGVRPKDVGGPGELSALHQHLGDMRAIVANRLKIDLSPLTRKVR